MGDPCEITGAVGFQGSGELAHRGFLASSSANNRRGGKTAPRSKNRIEKKNQKRGLIGKRKERDCRSSVSSARLAVPYLTGRDRDGRPKKS